MDETLNTLMKEYDLTGYEALVVFGIMGIVAYNNDTNIENACDIVDEKLKNIAKEILAI